MTPLILAHHEAAIDPTLVEWIRHQIDSVTGLGAGTIVFALGAVVVLVPLVIGVMALRNMRRSIEERNE
jgi:hypothetical protein